MTSTPLQLHRGSRLCDSHYEPSQDRRASHAYISVLLLLVVRFFGRMTQGKEVERICSKVLRHQARHLSFRSQEEKELGRGQDEIFPPERLNSVKIQRRRPEGVGSQETGPIELAFCTAEQP